jgi:NitT/TauT family transport system ATP-binding protein
VVPTAPQAGRDEERPKEGASKPDEETRSMYMNEQLAPAHQRADPVDVRPMLDVDGVTLQYKTREHLVTATYRVSFQVLKSDRYILLGPSGCGKSTLLKAVGGFLQPTEGNIRLNGRDVKAPGPDRMMVFQEFDQLLPWKTVRQNVAFTLLKSGKLRGRAADEKAMQYIEKVNLAKFADSYPHMLSGGMKQRVAIARAMAMEPDILLMDEPFAALDALTRRKMQDELLQLWDETHFTVLFVTHSILEAITIGNRILLLSPHPGQVRAELNSTGIDEIDDATGLRMSEKIDRLLFSAGPQAEEGGRFHE